VDDLKAMTASGVRSVVIVAEINRSRSIYSQRDIAEAQRANLDPRVIQGMRRTNPGLLNANSGFPPANSKLTVADMQALLASGYTGVFIIGEIRQTKSVYNAQDIAEAQQANLDPIIIEDMRLANRSSSSANPVPLTVKDIQALSSAGVKPQAIINFINRSKTVFSPEDITAAQQANVDPAIIQRMSQVNSSSQPVETDLQHTDPGLTVDQIKQLTMSGVKPGVIIDQIDQSNSIYTAQDIVVAQQANVDPTVIQHMQATAR
jgi:hypothetical protein